MWLDYDEKYAVSEDGQVKHKKSGRIVKGALREGYRRIDIGNIKNVDIHRMVAQRFCPKIDLPGLTVDHIDRDKSNNRASNLRWVDKTTQTLNRVAPLGVSGHRHISPTGRKWRFAICRGYKNVVSMTFKTLPEAIAARDAYLEAVKINQNYI